MTIYVDIATLRGLATQLTNLADLVEADNDDDTCVGTWVGDPMIRSALKNIQHDWSNKRGEFNRYLKSVSQAAAAAAEAYGATDSDIAKAARH